MSKNSNFSSKKNLIQSIISAEPITYGAAPTSQNPTSSDTVKFAFHDGSAPATTGDKGQVVFNTGTGDKNSGIITVGGKLVSSKILSVDTSVHNGDSTGVKNIAISYVDEKDFEVKTSEIEVVDSEAAVMADGYTTEVMIGGLNKNVNIGGKNVTEVLDMILKPEYAPTFVDATCSIACTGHTNGEIVEVGTKTPDASSYSSSGSTAYTSNCGSYTAHGGNVTESFAINSNTADGSTYDTVTTKPGVFKVRATRSYAVGTEAVKTAKGTETRKIASNTTTLLANATDSANVNTDYHITARDKTADFTINYAYKIYATTDTDGVLTSLGLKTSVSNVEATLKGGTAGQMFAVPSSYTGVKIETYNATLNSWTDTTSAWTTDSTSFELADKTSKAYTTYKLTPANGADAKYRISATVK